jgi:ankyrin repeat protein
VQEGNFAEVVRLLSRNKRVGTIARCRHREYWRLLKAAIWNEHDQVLAWLLDQAASFLYTGDYRVPSALIGFAALRGSYTAVCMLLAAKADANAVGIWKATTQGCTALRAAAHNGDDRMVQLLVAGKANVRYHGTSRVTTRVAPLFCAVFQGHATTVCLLLAFKADVHATVEGHTALHEAVKTDAKTDAKADVVRALLEGKADVNVACTTYGDGRTPLHLAACDGSRLVLQTLLRAKAAVNLPDARSQTPLFRAAQRGRADAVRLLVQAKADIETGAGYYSTSLAVAAAVGNAPVVRRLLAAKARANVGTNAWTALCRAIDSRLLGIVQLLLDARAEPNATDAQSTAPLTFAVERGSLVSMVPVLLAAKADVDGSSAHNALSPLFAAAICDNADFVQAFLEAKADVNFRVRTDGQRGRHAVWAGKSPVIGAACTVSMRSLQMLLDAKADVDFADAEGLTALSLAAQLGLLDVAQVLVAARADVNRASATGETPATYSAKSRFCSADVLRVLIKAKADVDLGSVHGYTARWWAKGDPLKAAAVADLAS